jgi:heat shock protein HslJ
MRRETAFLEALQETRGFSLQADGMSILDEDGNVLASFVPRDAV